MKMVYKIEGYENLFEVVDQSKTQTTYGAIAVDSDGLRHYAFFITPFPDMVEIY